MRPAIHFLFACCQVGAEAFLKRETAIRHPQLTLAFSRPGFVTFKAEHPDAVDVDQPLQSVFARSWGVSLGAIGAGDFQAICDALPALPYRHLHVWARDTQVPGDQHFEPFPLPASRETGQQLKQFGIDTPLTKVAVNRTARVGDYVVDVIQVEPQRWFVGWHRALSVPTRWPGGVPPLKPPDQIISRAYLKMDEALRWSQLPLAEGDLCAELGSSPGGSCQALLDHGCRVMGIDPAVMDERLLENPNFTHVRARAADLKRKEFAPVRWLMADANIAPSNTLDDLEAIVTHPRVKVRGMLVTLKLLEPAMANQIDEYVGRIHAWGYRFVRVRQLAFNRREVCVMAVPSKSHLRRRWRRVAPKSSRVPEE